MSGICHEIYLPSFELIDDQVAFCNLWDTPIYWRPTCHFGNGHYYHCHFDAGNPLRWTRRHQVDVSIHQGYPTARSLRAGGSPMRCKFFKRSWSTSRDIQNTLTRASTFLKINFLNFWPLDNYISSYVWQKDKSDAELFLNFESNVLTI